MDSREKAAVNKAVSAAMDAVNARQDKAIAELAEKVEAQGVHLTKLDHQITNVRAQAKKDRE